VSAGGGLAERAVARLGRRRRPALEPVVMVALSVLFASWHPRALTRHPALLEDLAGQPEPGGDVTDPSFHRFMDILQPEAWAERVRIVDLVRFAPELAEGGYLRATTSGWCVHVWANYRSRSVHRFGLTDAVLARVEMPERKRGHKPGLWPMAKGIARLQAQAFEVGRGMYREAVREGRAPEWVARNLETIEVIERKIYNRHDFLENVKLALRFPAKIDPGEIEE
jgi:hypothetical protein